MLSRPPKTSRLQDVSGEAEDGSETGTGGGESLISSTSESGDRRV